MTRDSRLFSALLMLATLAGCQQSPPLVEREGYYTWVDEQGQVRTSRVPVRARTPEPLPVRAAEPAPAEPETTDTLTKASSPEPSSMAKSAADRSDELESAAASETESTNSSSVATGAAQAGEEEYNLTNYPDAEALEAAGYIRPGDPLPYFTWRDANGQLQVSYYRPDTRSDVEKGLVQPPVSLTPAKVYQARPPQTGADRAPESAAGGEAFLVLGIEPSGPGFFQRWQQRCCRALPVEDVVAWSNSREFQVTLPENAPDYPFLSGISPYRLVRLPDATAAASLVLRLRSFANEGLFIPSAAFLNESLEPVRLVTDLVMEYTPESWHRQGYLQAMLPAFPAGGERWLLLYTTAADLAGQTVVETRRGPRAIPHRRQGLLSVTEMNP